MVLLEARLISLYYLKSQKEATHFFKALYNNISPSNKTIFLIKYINFLELENNVNQARIYLKKIISQPIDLKDCSLGFLRLWLVVAQTCASSNMVKKSQELSSLLSQKFEEMEDELSQLETLYLLRNCQSALWNHLLKKTHYVNFKKNFFQRHLANQTSPYL